MPCWVVPTAAGLSVLVVAEWLNLDWASHAPQPLPNNIVHAEWITLHDNPNFRGFVDFLRWASDRVGSSGCTSMRQLLFSRCGARTLAVAAGEEVIRRARARNAALIRCAQASSAGRSP